MSVLTVVRSEDRDINSAQVCLTWASGLTPRHPRALGNAEQERGQELSSLDMEPPSSTLKTRKHTGALKQLGALKRQKPQPQR